MVKNHSDFERAECHLGVAQALGYKGADTLWTEFPIYESGFQDAKAGGRSWAFF